MREKILELEKSSAVLWPDRLERKETRDLVVKYTEDFIENIETTQAYRNDPSKGARIKEFVPGSQELSMAEIIEQLGETMDGSGINPASGGHLGYIPGGGIYASSLADYWAAITNRYAGVFFANPGAVRVENKLIRWMNGLVGYPEGAHGNLTSGGSMANLIGVVTAREAKSIGVDKVKKAGIYLTQQAHLSIAKSLIVAGLNEAAIRYIPLDEKSRMDTLSLKEQIAKDKDQGIVPFLIVATAGTTDTGAIDPLDNLADIAESNNMWLHIDAAYGGFFILVDQFKDKFKGIERSDSLVMDPHKGMFIPYGLGACLIRRGKNLQEAFTVQASYLQDIASATEEINPMDVSPEMTKHFRGLRLWVPLALYGIGPFKTCLEEKLLLARYFHKEIAKIQGFEVGPAPQLSVVNFRYVPQKGNANEFNKRLVEEIHKDGRIFFSSTTINGNFMLRLAILSFRTHLRTIDLTLEILKEKAALIRPLFQPV